MYQRFNGKDDYNGGSKFRFLTLVSLVRILLGSLWRAVGAMVRPFSIHACISLLLTGNKNVFGFADATYG